MEFIPDTSWIAQNLKLDLTWTQGKKSNTTVLLKEH